MFSAHSSTPDQVHGQHVKMPSLDWQGKITRDAVPTGWLSLRLWEQGTPNLWDSSLPILPATPGTAQPLGMFLKPSLPDL
jgi:hypothetical protein